MDTHEELKAFLPLRYEDGPDYCTVTDKDGASFALTVRPDAMKAMEQAALAALTPAEPPTGDLTLSVIAGELDKEGRHRWAAKIRDEFAERGQPVAQEMADWSNLPKDIYVISAKSHGGIAFDVTCCSVPMVMIPEVRYTRADLVKAPVEPAYWIVTWPGKSQGVHAAYADIEEAEHAAKNIANYSTRKTETTIVPLYSLPIASPSGETIQPAMGERSEPASVTGEPPVDAGSPYLCPKCSSHAVPHIVSGMGLRATCACGFSGGEHEFTATAGDR